MSHNDIQQLSMLLVVPSKLQRKLLMDSLGRFGVEDILVCRTYHEALDKMRERQPSLVASSMYFEDGNGLDLIRAMKDDSELASIDFMLISAEQRFSVLDPLRQAGVLAVLPTPFNEEDLYRALHTSAELSGPVDLDIDLESLDILVVDDSLLARKHMCRVLKTLGIDDRQITQAEDGVEALTLLESNPFDIVFTDYNMPNMDGEALLQRIRQIPRMANVPVFMVTSEQDQTSLASVQSSGVTALMDKPFDLEYLKYLLAIHNVQGRDEGATDTQPDGIDSGEGSTEEAVIPIV